MYRSTLIIFLLSLTNVLVGQVEITDIGTNPSSASDCITAYQTQSVVLSSSMSCVDPLEILYDKGDMITGIGSSIDTFSGNYTLKFDSIGIYSFVCGSKNFADQCYHVLEPIPTPTVGEWGLIILSLLLMNVGLIALKSSREVAT